jgi:hypothetical protein
MSQVIDLAAAREERTPHLSGAAVCLNCRHQWIAVAPVGVFQMECPSCHTEKGVWNRPVGDDLVWMCNCGSYHFAITKTHALCLHCGTLQVF